MQYKLTINEHQAKVISFALDFYSRISGGQFEQIVHRFDWQNSKEDNVSIKATALLVDLKCVLTGLNKSEHNIGLGNICEDGKIAYDLHQVIRHKLANTDSSSSHPDSVDFNVPRQVSNEALAEIDLL